MKAFCTPRTLIRGLSLGLLLSLSLAAVGDDFLQGPEDHRDYSREPWREEETSLPPFPQTRHLMELNVPQVSGRLRYAIDAENLSVGDDGVVRYTVVVSSSSGARSVFFEGLRCSERTYKIYAYGHGGDSFRRRQDPQWQPIPRRGSQAFRDDLRRSQFCDRFGNVRPRHEIIRHLRGDFTLDL
ncbi:MAG: CNP1-like family protein [Gammaproteobacteria bacterium]|nr:CNP1-like family protein [Gammaproteobacteria bacterium]